MSDADTKAGALQVVFGRNFKTVRHAAGFTQQEAAEKSGIPQQYISQIEGGKRNLTVRTMCALAESVKETVTSLLDPFRFKPKK